MYQKRETITSIGAMTKGVQHTMVTLTLCCLLHVLFFCVLSAMAGDVDLLISFKNSLPNPNLLSNWNRTHGVCQFQGVTCKGSHVSSLTIRGLPLEADFNSVSAHILSLGNLEALSLHSTNLTGSISTLANCTMRLKELDLSSNNLRGSVYDTASLAASCHSLQSLNLSNNYIGQTFNCSSPVLARLKMLDLSDNKITTNEDIQWIFSKLRLLKYLDLSNNTIKGTIPQITNCTSLQYLDLSSNQLTGTIPAGTFSGCLNLTYLNLSSNHFTGMAPPDIEACTNLVTLSLSKNNFSGEFPMGSLIAISRLQFLDLAFNNFNALNLKHNRLSGPLPQELGDIASLIILDLSHNAFEGRIPSSFSALSLSTLDLSNNQLSGPIPELGSLVTFPKYVFENNSGLCGFPLPPCIDSSVPMGDVPQQSSTNHGSSRDWWIALGLLFFGFLIIGFVIGQFL